MIKAMSSYTGSQQPQSGGYQSVYSQSGGPSAYTPKPQAPKRKAAPGDVYSARRAWKQAGGTGDWRAYMPGAGGYQNAPLAEPGGMSMPAYAPPSQPGTRGGAATPGLLDGGWGQPNARPSSPIPPYAAALPQGGFNASYGQLGGGYGSTPDFNRRDAFINNINETMAGYQGNQGTYQGNDTPPATWGQAPQFDFPALWKQAGNMVQSGWQNPLLGLLG